MAFVGDASDSARGDNTGCGGHAHGQRGGSPFSRSFNLQPGSGSPARQPERTAWEIPAGQSGQTWTVKIGECARPWSVSAAGREPGSCRLRWLSGRR